MLIVNLWSFWLISFLEEKENTLELNRDEEYDDLGMATSKDTLHILRLAAVLHVLHETVNSVLENTNYLHTPEISNTRIRQAKTLYNVLVQHRAIFLQVLVFRFIFILFIQLSCTHYTLCLCRSTV